MKIQNYGDWKGDKPGGHHPPACTCYRCNEERRQLEAFLEAFKEEEHRVVEYDRRVEEGKARSRDKKQQGRPSRSPSRNQTSARGRPRSSQPRQTGSQRRAGEAVRQSVAGARPTVRTRPAPSPQRPRKQQGRVFEVSRAVTASALRYALVLHTVAAVGLAVYALTQGGPSNVLPTLDGAADAYVQAWRSVGNVAGLG